MKRIVFTVGLVSLVSAVAILAQTQTESVEQELIRLENEWADAWLKSDVAFFDRIMADDYTWTSPWGDVSTKADNFVTRPRRAIFFPINSPRIKRIYLNKHIASR